MRPKLAAEYVRYINLAFVNEFGLLSVELELAPVSSQFLNSVFLTLVTSVVVCIVSSLWN